MLSKVSFHQNFKFCYDTLYAYIDCFIAVTTNSSKKSITELWFKRYVNMHSPALHLMLFSNCALVYRKNPVFQTLQFMYPVGCLEKMTPCFVSIHFSSPFSSIVYIISMRVTRCWRRVQSWSIHQLFTWYFGRLHTFFFAFFKHRIHNLYESHPMLTASSILKYTSIIYFGRPHTFFFAFFKHRTHNLYESRPMLTASSILKYTSIIYFGHKSNSSI